MTRPTTFAVLVSLRTDPVSGRATRNRNDALAVALALRHAAPGDVRLLHAGSMGEDTARDYLALGAGSIELIDGAAGASPAGATAASTHDTAALLATAVGDAALVLTGMRADDDHGSGLLPHAVAAALDRPLVADVVALQPDGAAWIVTQALPKGARRRLHLRAPAVLAVAPNAPLVLRYAHADRIAGRVVRQATPRTAAAPMAMPLPVPSTAERRVPAARRLKPLEARVALSGHARMQAAVGGSAAAGGTVITTGSPGDKAQLVLQYLRRHALIDF